MKKFNYYNSLGFDSALVNAGLFFGSAPFISVGATSFEYALLVTAPTREVHGQLSITATDRILMSIYHAPTITDNGTSVLVNNFKTFSSNVAGTTMFSAPTVAVEGTFITQLLIPGSGSPSGIGVSESPSKKFILPPSSMFLIKFEDITPGGKNSDVMLQVNFYEKLFPTEDIPIDEYY